MFIAAVYVGPVAWTQRDLAGMQGDVEAVEIIFARPSVMPRVLQTAPVLESWDAADHPNQRRLAAYLDEVNAVVHACVPAGCHHLALELAVGLPEEAALTKGGRDLDNYLFPIARRIGSERLDAVFARKQHASTSTIAVSAAVHQDGSPGEPQLRVRTTSSSQSLTWKWQIHDACSAVVGTQLPDGPMAMRIQFTVSRRRNWSALWKPAIDALGPVLGTPDPRKPFCPNDDRIVDLALHRSIDDVLGNDVDIAVWWQQLVT